MIPYGRQSISKADIEAVVRVLRSPSITQGPAVEAFERAVADYCGARHAVAVASGTAGLHLACLAFRLGPGDLLWTSPNTFLASANCARYCGADVDFVDIDPVTYNLDVAALERKLEAAERRRRLPSVVVPVHFAGRSCDMQAIRELSERYSFVVVEDGTHALGGRYKGEPVGSCSYSDAAVFSFHPVKAMTTGEGGMVVTNVPDAAALVRVCRSHGVTRDPKSMSQEPDGPWYYEQNTLGFNYRLTDFQAALGMSQLERLDAFVDRRNELADRYDRLLAGLPLLLPVRTPDVRHAFHLYVVRVRPAAGRPERGAAWPPARGAGRPPERGARRRAAFDALAAAGIAAQVHYIPVHLQPYYRRLGFGRGDFPEAERYYEETLTLPLYADLTENEQDGVVVALRDALGEAG